VFKHGSKQDRELPSVEDGLPYIAPEFIEERSNNESTAMDFWSLGCIIYEMITKKKAFEAKSEEELF
jgi:serine/threonine protein kinase